MRFGVCTDVSHLPALQAAGWDYIELALAGALKPEQPQGEILPPLQQALAASSLKAETYNVFLPGEVTVVGENVDEARQDRYLEEAFARAAALGGQVVVFGSGGSRRIPDGFPPAQANQQMIDFTRRAGEAAARHGVTIAIEPLNVSECNYINSVGEALTLADAVGHPAVGVLSDLYHVTHDGQTYDETRQAGERLRHVHIAGAEGRRAPIADDFEFLVPYFRVLREIGYGGRISVEGGWADVDTQAADCLDVLRRAWDAAA